MSSQKYRQDSVFLYTTLLTENLLRYKNRHRKYINIFRNYHHKYALSNTFLFAMKITYHYI